MKEIVQLHKEQFGKEANLFVKAPGRINILGEHLDYNGGIVLPAAVDRFLQFSFSTCTDLSPALDVWAASVSERKLIDVNTPTIGWASYFKNTLVALEEQGKKLDCKLQIAFDGNIPLGAGMSSSAALCCGLIYGISELFDWQLSMENMARLAQRAEHLTGANCGLMDQYAVLFSKTGHLLSLDCSKMAVEYIPWQMHEVSLVLVNSKVDHQLAGAGSVYNKRRSVCEKALVMIQKSHPEVTHLAKAKLSHLETIGSLLSSQEIRKVEYVIRESERVKLAKLTIESGSARDLGQLMYDTHKGLKEDFEVSVSETDLLVDFGHQIDGVFGARMVGGGFGGCVLYLVDKSKVSTIIDSLHRKYLHSTGIDALGFEIDLTQGVSSESIVC